MVFCKKHLLVTVNLGSKKVVGELYFLNRVKFILFIYFIEQILLFLVNSGKNVFGYGEKKYSYQVRLTYQF